MHFNSNLGFLLIERYYNHIIYCTEHILENELGKVFVFISKVKHRMLLHLLMGNLSCKNEIFSE